MASDKFLKAKANYKKGVLPGSEPKAPPPKQNPLLKSIAERQPIQNSGIPKDPIGKALADEKKKNEFKLPPKEEWDKYQQQAKTPQHIQELKKNIEAPKQVPGFVAAAAGATDAITMGLLKNNRRTNPLGSLDSYDKQAQEQHPYAYGGGQLAGYLLPGTLAEKGAGLAVKGTTLAAKLGRGALAGSAFMGGESAIRGESGKDIAKNALLGAGLGVVAEGVFHGAGKVINKLKPTSKPLVEAAEEATTTKSLNFKPSTLNETSLAMENATKTKPLIKPQSKTQKFKFNDPEVEAIYKQNKGIKNNSLTSKIKEGINKTTNSFTRTFTSLEHNAENAELIKDLVRLPKVKAITGADTVRVLDDITTGLDKDTFDLFSRKVLLDDLAEEAQKGNKLPNNFTPELVQSELKRINSIMPENVAESLNKRNLHWNNIKNDYINAMDEIGIDVKDKFQRDNYFRHQVLDYMQNNGVKGAGSKLKTPINRGFSKTRTGDYTGNINTDYLQAEYEVMAQMKHDAEVARTIKNIKNNYDISSHVKQLAKEQGLGDWRQAIPEGYTTWQPREGNTFYFADSIPGKLADQLSDNLIKEWNLSPDDVKKVLAVGGKRNEFVVKEAVADTLNNLFKNKPTNTLSEVSKKVQSMWKGWILTGNPRSVIKYNIRNFSGDLDPIITGNPSTLKKIPRASKELYDVFKNNKFTKELKEFADMGGLQETLYAQEIGDVNNLKPFNKFKDKTTKDYLTFVPKKYFDTTKNITNFRELISRYAAYLDYKEQLIKGNGIPKNFGASKPEVINGLKNINDKAYKLSNDLLGAYDEVSEGGQVLRNHLIPFYSWLEVNMKRYSQIAKNIISDGTTTEKIGKGFYTGARIGGKVAYNVGKLTVGATLLTSTLAIWNNTMYSGLEDTLPDDVKARPHIILGKDKDGNTLYFSRLGALNDYMEWFGMGTITQDVKDIMDGKRTLKEQVVTMVKQPINKIASSISPFYKTPAELISGRKMYPDVFSTTQIRDKGQYSAQTINVGKEYDAITGKPSKPYGSTLSEALIYKADPEESAYFKILEEKRRFKEKVKGDQGEMFFSSPKSNALYNYKKAVKLDDKEAMKKYLEEYKKLGGTERGKSQSFEMMNPLYGLSAKDEKEFMEQLSTSDKAKLLLAKKYYNDIIIKSKK